MPRPDLLIDKLEGGPVHTAKQPRPHVAQEYRDRGLLDDAEDLVRGLRPWAQDQALGMDRAARRGIRHA